MRKIYVKIEGIHCDHCKGTIANALLKKESIKSVTFQKHIACISYEGAIDVNDIIQTINSLDYFTKEAYISEQRKNLKDRIALDDFVVILAAIFVCAMLLRHFFGYNIFNVIPSIDSSITYGMLVVTGMLTSIHCIGMCGAINLTAVSDLSKRNLKRPILYNAGRVLSYTLIGGAAGLLGSVISIDERVSGVILLLAAIVMCLMALNMLGIVDFELPKLGTVRTGSRNPFVIGLLNGLMPCGPLQAMQIYALSTGSAAGGALAMFLFGIGTVPLMLFMGVLVNFLKGRRRILVNQVASVLILVLAVSMFGRGLLSLNIDLAAKTEGLYSGTENTETYTSSTLMGDYQVVEFDLSYGGYEDVIVQKDVPVRMIIHVAEEYLTGCNNEVVLREYGIRQKLTSGENIIEFTPTETGTYTYTCWMNMLKNNIKVVDDEAYFEKG